MFFDCWCTIWQNYWLIYFSNNTVVNGHNTRDGPCCKIYKAKAIIYQFACHNKYHCWYFIFSLYFCHGFIWFQQQQFAASTTTRVASVCVVPVHPISNCDFKVWSLKPPQRNIDCYALLMLSFQIIETLCNF